MSSAQSDLSLRIKLKRRAYPVGRLGAHIKHGMNCTFRAFFQEYDRVGLPRVGAASIRP